LPYQVKKLKVKTSVA